MEQRGRGKAQMTYTEKVLGKATVKGVADYLLFGIGTEKDERGYEQRLAEVHKEFDAKVMVEDTKERSEILDLANELTCEIALIYAELGMQAALLIVKDMFSNLDLQPGKRENTYRGACDFLIARIKEAISMAGRPEDEKQDKVICTLERSLVIADILLKAE